MDMRHHAGSGTDSYQGFLGNRGRRGHHFLKNRQRFWSDQQTPLPEKAPFSSVVMIFGGDEGVIERARTTLRGRVLYNSFRIFAIVVSPFSSFI
jgi:hypothetical protein